SCVMVCAYGIIAVPPAIVTIGMVETLRKTVDNRSCPQCSREGHEADAHFCFECGADLDQHKHSANDDSVELLEPHDDVQTDKNAELDKNDKSKDDPHE
ncbi:MAG: hypothetical protein HRU15_15245, partial [Planctomycetes bacterium]|nr:hypothetical protein [Planctomycetota bacterium]